VVRADTGAVQTLLVESGGLHFAAKRHENNECLKV
jgi:hypothetical protein